MKFILIIYLLFSIASYANTKLQKVSLHLKWKHSFQFAGYYAAIEKGFYKDLGLDVSLIEGGPTKLPLNFVISGAGRYGISDSSLLQHHLNKKPVVLITQIFQHSPLVILSHKDSNITNAKQMDNKTLSYLNEIIIDYLIKKENVQNINRLIYINEALDKFINKEIDLLTGYTIITPFLLKEKGIETNIINPRNYGIDFYGDNLFTSKDEALNFPKRVKKMKEATLKGWEYALKNPDEIIRLIKEKYNKDISIESLEFEASELNKIILPQLIPLGTIDKKRYEHVLDGYKSDNKFLNRQIDNSFYFELDQKDNNIEKKIALTNHEINWLSKHNNLTFTGDPDWLPLEAFNEQGEYIGIVSDYLKEISKQSGINFDIKKTDSWVQSMDYSKNRIVDILSDTTESYRDDVIFTKPYFKSEVVIVMNSDQTFVNSLDTISNKKIAVVKDYSYITKITSAYPNIDFVKVDSVKEGLKAVSRGEIDAFLCTLPNASYNISQMGLTNIKIVGKTKFSTELGFAIRNDYQPLVSILNKAIDNIPQFKKNEIFNKWVKISYVEATDYSLLIKIVLLFIAILSWFLYTNNRMKKEINLRKELEKNLKNSELKAISANKSKSEFLANMSHEIRTPMNSIIGFSELLEQTELNHKQKTYLSSIIKSSKNLLDIINDILDLSKIEAGKLTIQKEFINLKSILNDMNQLFIISAKEKDLLLEVSTPENLPKNIFSDEIRIRQILVNLIGNAIKFTEKGFVKVYLKVKINEEKDVCDININIQDSGIGIKKEEQDKIFKNFEQQDGQSTRKYGGTGLGLAISKKLVKKLNGDIDISSKEGKGSTFTIKFKNIKYNNQIEETYINKTNIQDYFFKKSTILVVDDIEENRELIKGKLSKHDINILEAQNGQIAVDILYKNTNIDLVLMDIRMPVMDGYEALKKIKENNNLAKLPVIAITASIIKKEQDKIIEKGFNSFLQKPIIHEDFMKTLSEYLDSEIVIENSDKVDSLELFTNNSNKDEFNKSFKNQLEKQEILNNFTLLNKLSEDIKGFANKHKEDSLLKISIELEESVSSFDIENIQNIIKRLKVNL